MGTNTCSEIDLWKPKLTIRWSETKPTHKPHSANSKETNPWGWECDLILLCLMAGATTKWPHQNNRQEATPPYRENTEEFPLLRHHPCTDPVVGEQQTLAEKPHLASTLGMLRADHCICVLMVVLVLNKLTSSTVLINAVMWVTASNKPCPNQYEFFWFRWTPWMEGYHGVFCHISFAIYHKFKFLFRWTIEVEIFDFYVF